MKLIISNAVRNFLLVISAVVLILLGLILFWLYFPGQFYLFGWLFGILVFVGAAKLWFGIYRRYGVKAIVITVFVIVLVYAACTWYGAYDWADKVQADEFGWYRYSEINRMEIKNAYDLAFEKIILVGGFAFSSLAVALRMTKE